MRSFIDTDPGLDDALAILAALAGPELAVAGLTTVAGNLGLEVTTRNARRLAALAGWPQLPVVRGAARPLARAPRAAADIHGPEGLGSVALPEPPGPETPGFAPDWLAAALMASAEPAQVLALGPLTNLALLLRDHPAAAGRIARIVAMGGALEEPGNVGPRAEFNFASDPEAAAAVLGAGVPVVLVPLDVTRRVRAERAILAPRPGDGPRAAAARAILSAYFPAGDPVSRPLHDPCVTAFALAPGLFRGRRRALSVETAGPDAGALLEGGTGAAEVLTGVDASAVAALLAARLGLDEAA